MGIFGLGGGLILGGLVYLVGGFESDILILLTIVLARGLVLILMFIRSCISATFGVKAARPSV